MRGRCGFHVQFCLVTREEKLVSKEFKVPETAGVKQIQRVPDRECVKNDLFSMLSMKQF